MMSTVPPEDGHGYRIGAVARLTGIETVTIRMWERRYAVVEPLRSAGGNRLYSRDDIARLAMIKRLVDEGNAIGTIAHLSPEQLRERLDLNLGSSPVEPASQDCRIAILGDVLPARLAGGGADLPGLNMVVVERDPKAFLRQTAQHHPDVIVLEFPTVQDETILDVFSFLARSGATRAVVIYGFGRRADLARLEGDRVRIMKAPIGLSELRLACMAPSVAKRRPAAKLTASQPPESGIVPARRFGTDEMLRLAEASTTVHCECPKHLVDLLLNLHAFETYSSECIDRSPEDAALHGYLHLMTAQARSRIEEALARLVEVEGLG